MDLQAFIITFREALEALLIVGIIIIYLSKMQYSHWNKWVWVGVVLALVSSFGVALIFQVVLIGYGSMASQNYLRFTIMFISAGLLTHMILFIGQQNINFQSTIQSKVNHIITTGSIINMLIHSYLVVLREGIETVFFFAAISGGDIQKALSSWGALLGLLSAAAVAYYFFKGTKKVPLGLFFKATSFLLALIAAGLIVQGIGVMQDLKLMGSLYKTPGGEIGEIYNIISFMPEHPIDEEQYIRDTSNHPLIGGGIGIFFKAFLGYTHNPSLEEFGAYWLYFLSVYILLARKRKKVQQSTTVNKEQKIV
ncbi:FTR1 family iron permease [Bacillus sp. Marseille-P3661]|uniref:FTR1 family iron permease n=1 Tax=Bacillus sp. Marseille-P3661 TaxID=1936234 RepID=UPI000C82D062|nr:FTR1 family protein [Bacillus sp. Marseille-P3661]